MDREKQIPHGAPARGRRCHGGCVDGACILRGPLEFYQVTVEATPAPAGRRLLRSSPPKSPPGETIPVEEDTSSEGPARGAGGKERQPKHSHFRGADLLPGVGPAIAQRIIDYGSRTAAFTTSRKSWRCPALGERPSPSWSPTSQWNKNRAVGKFLTALFVLF